MANEDKQKVGNEKPTEENSKPTDKDKANDSSGKNDQAGTRTIEGTEVIDQEAYNDQLATQGFYRLIPESVATPGKKYIKAIQRFDRKSTAIQPAELWKFRDPEIETRGRF